MVLNETLGEQLRALAAVAAGFADAGEELAGVIAAEPAAGLLLYLCAYRRDEALTYLAFDPEGNPVIDRELVLDAVSIVGLCELAEESAAGGDVNELRRRLADVAEREAPPGVEDADAAAAALEETLEEAPRLASVAYLDALGAAATRLEQALGEVGNSPFGRAMSAGHGAVEALAEDVESNYKRPFA